MSFGQAGSSQANQGAIWYFGNYAGLTWCDNYLTTGEPEALLDGQLITNEGVATIADANCNLLFYTDGIKAWDANHLQMANTYGSSVGGTLLGNPSSTQSGVIIPKPQDPNTFYIFAVDDIAGVNGITYSRVDMTANMGMGDIDVTEKNVPLYSPSCEKISAVNHVNGTDIWVISHQWQTNTFVAYLVTNAGVNVLTPVYSNVGQIATGTTSNTRGYLKASPGGTMLVNAVEGDSYYELFDFNNATGVISNPILLQQSVYEDCYGVEFSPDEHYLYGSERWGYPLRQYDLTAANILASEVQVGSLSTEYGGALQLAIDGRIYLARNYQNYLGRINDPMAGGLACGYVDQAAYLGNPSGTDVRVSKEGLPTFITSFFNQAEFEFETSCYDTVTTFTIPNAQGLDMAYWNFNYPSTDPQWLLQDTITTVEIVYEQGGVYQVELITERNNDFDTLIQTVYVSYIPDADLGPDLVLCTNESVEFDMSFNDVFSLTGACEYYWEAEIGPNTYFDSSAVYLIDKPGTYTLTIYADSICGTSTDIVEVAYNNVVADLGLDISGVLCLGQTQILDATYNDPAYGTTTYAWSTNQISNTINVTNSGTYTVTVTLDNCQDIDEINVFFDNPLVPPFGPDDYLCAGTSMILYANNPGASYIWSTGGTGSEEELSLPGIYSVTIMNACGTIEDEIELFPLDIPEVDLGQDVTVCIGLAEVLDASTGFAEETYQWSTNAQTPQIAVLAEGLYSVTVTNKCGSNIDDIYVYGDLPVDDIFPADTIICEGSILDTNVPNAEYLWSTGDVTQSIVITTPGDYGIDITNACGSYSDVVHVEFLLIEDPLPDDTVICPGEPMILDAGNPGCMYSWSTGALTQSTQVAAPGQYIVEVTNICETISDTVNVTLFDPNLDLGPDTTICDGNMVLLDATHIGASYNWSNGATTASIETGTTGSYSVTVTHVCGILNDDLALNVLESPTIDFGTDTIISQSNSIVLAPSISGATSYLWSTNETTENITVTQPDWYSIIATGDNGCQTELEVFVDFYWGIPTSTKEDQLISIYPNPTANLLNIKIDGLVVNKLEVYNSIGGLVSSTDLIQEHYILDTDGYSTGIYFIKLQTSERRVIIKPFNVIK